MTLPHRWPRQGQVAVAASLTLFTACGVAAALFAARLLTSAEYTVFAAFSGILGILVLGPASSLEQNSVIRRGSRAAVLRSMAMKALILWVLVTVILLVPLTAWQQRLLGAWTDIAVRALIICTPVIFALAVLRGLTIGRRRYITVALTHVAAGLGTLLLPLSLYRLGLPALTSFVLGTAFAWVPALVLITLAQSRSSECADAAAGPRMEGNTTWLVIANFALLAHLLAVPPLLRWHVDAIGADLAADLQLLVSMSRLSTTLVLASLPLMLSGLRASTRSVLGVDLRALTLTASLGGLAVLVSVAFGSELLALLTERETSASPFVILLATLPAVALCPAVGLMAVALVRRQYGLVSLAWCSGLVILGGTVTIDARAGVTAVLSGVLLAAAMPPLVLVFGLRRWTSAMEMS